MHEYVKVILNLKSKDNKKETKMRDLPSNKYLLLS